MADSNADRVTPRFNIGGSSSTYVDDYRSVWRVDACHTNYAIRSINGGWLVWGIYGNSTPEQDALNKYRRGGDVGVKCGNFY
jgi:hypothetical protein